MLKLPVMHRAHANALCASLRVKYRWLCGVLSAGATMHAPWAPWRFTNNQTGGACTTGGLGSAVARLQTKQMDFETVCFDTMVGEDVLERLVFFGHVGCEQL